MQYSTLSINRALTPEYWRFQDKAVSVNDRNQAVISATAASYDSARPAATAAS